MEGSCPNCRTRLDFPRSGVYQCERCRARFEVALGSPVAPAPAVAAPYAYARSYPTPGSLQASSGSIEMPAVTPGLEAPCVNHAANPAVGVCERCGDFMCRLCATMVEGRAYCPKCFDLLYSRGSLQFAQRQFTTPAATLALGIISGIMGLIPCVGVLALPLAIGGLVLGFQALKQINARPDLPGKRGAVVGIVCSGLGILATAVWVVVWFVRFAK